MKYIYLIAIVSLVSFSCKTYPPLTVTSPAFEHNTMLPEKYTCDGEGINPPIHISHIPAATKSLVLIADDPDVLITFDHWIVFNIQPGDIAENSKPGIEGLNGKGTIGYMGSCPPHGTHHYHYKVYALNLDLDLKAGVKKNEVEKAMKGHIIAFGEIVGLYKKKPNQE